MGEISKFDSVSIITDRIGESQIDHRNTAFQIVEQAGGDDFRAAGQIVLDVARGKMTIAEIKKKLGENFKLGIEVTGGLVEIISLAMSVPIKEISVENYKILAQRAQSTVEAINNNLRGTETWEGLVDTFRQQIDDHTRVL